MNFPSRLQAKKASHFPINEPHNPVIINYTVRISQVIMHEAHVWIGIGIREENIAFKGLDTAVATNVGIRHDVRANLASIGRLDSV